MSIYISELQIYIKLYDETVFNMNFFFNQIE